MQSLRFLYRIGNGPSSSHTMGPIAAARRFLADVNDAEEYKIILYGSLAKTGRGHMTDSAVRDVFAEHSCQIIFDCDSETDVHPNTMDIIAYRDGDEIARRRFYSVGGGEVCEDGEFCSEHESVYPMRSFDDISAYCREREMRLWQYVEECEGREIWDYLSEVWKVMQSAIKRGISEDGILPGGIGLQRKA
ncbi:MAG: serine dehydratase, partial [Clostridia bacterium]|nr:serine dehydratase [Clostridia bacterium]